MQAKVSLPKGDLWKGVQVRLQVQLWMSYEQVYGQPVLRTYEPVLLVVASICSPTLVQ